jgi:hypothetical protein
MRRRDLMIALGVFAAVFTIPPLYRRAFSEFEFTPLTGFDGFRRLKYKASSSAPDFLMGMDSPTPEQIRTREAFHRDPCTFLFGPPVPDDNRLPIALFSDYFCPYCATLSRQLMRREREQGDIRLILHELPLLGPQSLRTAKIALAAKQQGKHLEAHAKLMDKMLPPGPVATRLFAEQLDLDPVQLARDAEGAQVATEIQVAGTLAKSLGIFGTPGTLIGRTLLIGALPSPDIDRLVELERSEPFAGCF